MTDIKHCNVLMVNYNKKVKKTQIFLGLMKKFRLIENSTIYIAKTKSVYSLHFNTFKKTYVSLLNIIYIFEFLNDT